MKKPSKKSCATPPRGLKKSKSPSRSKAGSATATKSKKKINSRAKGCRGELEFSHFLKARGIEARRGQQFAGGTDSPDVIAGGVLRDFHIEVKNTQVTNIYGWLAQACTDMDLCKTPVIAHKKNGKPWVAILDMRDFISLLVKSQGTNYAEVLKAVMP